MMESMSASTRRAFLAQTAALLPITQAALMARDALHKDNLGVQLYTVRNVIDQNPLKILKAIQDIGYGEIEAVYADLPKIWSALEQTNLKAISVHVDSKLLMTGGSALDDAFGKLRQRGFHYAVFPYLDESERGGLDVYKKLAATFNKIGEQAKAQGLTFCYHNHAFEFQPMNGTMPLNILLGETDKNLVSWEMDIFWVSVAGHDPVKLLKQYGDRVKLLHLKDKQRGFPTRYNEHVPKSTFKEVGHGSIDIPAVLAAAASTQVRHYFVEQDQTPGDPINSLRESYQYLTSVMKS
jgi:sugar phosphate isomerase/epimerase